MLFKLPAALMTVAFMLLAAALMPAGGMLGAETTSRVVAEEGMLEKEEALLQHEHGEPLSSEGSHGPPEELGETALNTYAAPPDNAISADAIKGMEPTADEESDDEFHSAASSEAAQVEPRVGF